jgi:hypothetical protein
VSIADHSASYSIDDRGFFLLNIRKLLTSSSAESGNEWSLTSSLFLWVYFDYGDNFNFSAKEVEQGEAFVFGAFSDHY